MTSGPGFSFTDKYYFNVLDCGPLPSVEHGTLTWNGTLEGDMSIAECHPTYFMSSGSAVRTCLNNCSWSGSDAVCTKIGR